MFEISSALPASRGIVGRLRFGSLRVLLWMLVLTGGGCEKIKSLGKSTAVPAAPLSGPVCREMKEADYPGLIATPGRLNVAVFHASWCGPCKQMEPFMEKVAAEFAGVAQVGRFDVDQCQALARQLGVNGIPDVRFFLNGKQVDSFMGAASESEIRDKFQAYTRGLIAAPGGDGKTPAVGQPPKAEPTIQRMPKDWMPPGMKKG